MSKVTDQEIENLFVKPDDGEVELGNQTNPAESYDKLTDYYYDAILSFGFMISRALPEQFQVGSKEETERLSCEAGVVAFGSCAEILQKQIQGTKNLILPTAPEDYDSLAKFYEVNFIQYVGDLSLNLPEKFHKGTSRGTEIRSCKAGIRAFDKARTSLIKQLGEMS